MFWAVVGFIKSEQRGRHTTQRYGQNIGADQRPEWPHNTKKPGKAQTKFCAGHHTHREQASGTRGGEHQSVPHLPGKYHTFHAAPFHCWRRAEINKIDALLRKGLKAALRLPNGISNEKVIPLGPHNTAHEI